MRSMSTIVHRGDDRCTVMGSPGDESSSQKVSTLERPDPFLWCRQTDQDRRVYSTVDRPPVIILQFNRTLLDVPTAVPRMTDISQMRITIAQHRGDSRWNIHRNDRKLRFVQEGEDFVERCSHGRMEAEPEDRVEYAACLLWPKSLSELLDA